MRLFRRRARWQPSWAVYAGQLPRGPVAMYFVDLGAVDAAPVTDLQVRWDISVTFPAAGDDGLPSAEEMDAVQALEDRVHAVAEKLGGAYVGRRLAGGGGRLTCYLPRPPVPVPRLSAAAGLAPQAEVDGDPGWRLLREQLAPDDRQRHIVGDLRVVQALLRHGADLARPRRVEHTGYFRTGVTAFRAADDLRADGFAVSVEEASDGRCALRAARVDQVVPPQLHELTWAVRQAVERCGGQYDGWGCFVDDTDR